VLKFAFQLIKLMLLHIETKRKITYKKSYIKRCGVLIQDLRLLEVLNKDIIQ